MKTILMENGLVYKLFIDPILKPLHSTVETLIAIDHSFVSYIKNNHIKIYLMFLLIKFIIV